MRLVYYCYIIAYRDSVFHYRSLYENGVSICLGPIQGPNQSVSLGLNGFGTHYTRYVLVLSRNVPDKSLQNTQTLTHPDNRERQENQPQKKKTRTHYGNDRWTVSQLVADRLSPSNCSSRIHFMRTIIGGSDSLRTSVGTAFLHPNY